MMKSFSYKPLMPTIQSQPFDQPMDSIVTEVGIRWHRRHMPPALVDVAVAGMPRGAPGLELAGASTEPFEVVAFDADGARRPLLEKRPSSATVVVLTLVLGLAMRFWLEHGVEGDEHSAHEGRECELGWLSFGAWSCRGRCGLGRGHS